MQKLLGTLVIALLTSCSSTGFTAVRAEAGAARFERDENVGTMPTLGSGILFKEDQKKTEPLRGWVGDAAIRLSTIEDDLGGATLSGDREELAIGTRFYPYNDVDWVEPYLGFGGMFTRLHLEDGDVGHSTTITPGGYGTVGVDFVLGHNLRLGVGYRHTFGLDAELEGDDEKSNLDGGAVVFSLGFTL